MSHRPDAGEPESPPVDRSVPVRPAWRTLLHVLVLLTGLGLWTWKLLEPNPVPEALAEHLTDELHFGLAKTLHASGYAFLTLLAVTLPVPSSWRWLFAGLLALHGVATEIGQTFVVGRHGCVRDVLIDWGGIAAAVLLWQLWMSEWLKSKARDRTQHTSDPW